MARFYEKMKRKMLVLLCSLFQRKKTNERKWKETGERETPNDVENKNERAKEKKRKNEQKKKNENTMPREATPTFSLFFLFCIAECMMDDGSASAIFWK